MNMENNINEMLERANNQSNHKVMISPSVILFRSDLLEGDKDLSIDCIGYHNFKIEISMTQLSPLLIFVDDNGNTKIIKNRFGDQGLCISEKSYKTQMLNSFKEGFKSATDSLNGANEIVQNK